MRTEPVEERVRAAEFELVNTVKAPTPSADATKALTLLHTAFDKRRRVQEALALAACATQSVPRK
jgi:hypothetical protein